MEIFEDQVFENIDFTIKGLPKGEYESCSFINCNLSDLNISGYSFIDCRFSDANLSLLKLNNTILRDIVFKDCKMIGLQFCDADAFGLAFSFENCILTNASFFKTKIKKTNFKDSKLSEVDFTECDLSESILQGCDLSGAIFSFSNVERVDFRTSMNYSIDPDNNKIKKSKHSASELGGLLDKYSLIID
jgi:uncharacterized protein YjbI with pentapeptide repeats